MSQAVIVSATEFKLANKSNQSSDGNGQMTDKEEAGTTSRLVAPSLQLLGHKGACLSLDFNHHGDKLAVACSDGHVYLWTFLDEDPQNYDDLPIHNNDVLQVRWSADDTLLVTASADRTARVTDVEKNERIKTMRHRSYVNSVAVTTSTSMNPLVLTGSDDKTACLWDLRVKDPFHTLTHAYQVVAVALTSDGSYAYTGGIDEMIHCYDLRKTAKPLFTLKGHSDTITSLALNSDGSVLLSNSMDMTLKLWDVRRAVSAEREAAGRIISTLTGHSHDAQQHILRANFSPDDRYVTSGSSDGNVYVWNVMSQQLLYALPGHRGAVSESMFHPTLPIIASASHDKSVFIGDTPQLDQQLL